MMMDAAEVKTLLAGQAEQVCEHLLPGGKRVKDEYQIGDVHGAEGQSLKICLSGSKAGWWCDFADKGEYRGKHLLSLWMAVRNCEFVQAITEAKEFLGIREKWERQTASKSAPKSTKKKAPAPKDDPATMIFPLDHEGKVYKYLTEERGLDEAALTAYHVGQNQKGDHVVFPSYDLQGELVSLKFLALERDERGKKKMFVQPGGAPAILFGLQAIPENQTECFITEGEIDAISMYQMGYPAVSVPFGAKWPGKDGKTDPNTPWIEHEYEWFGLFEKIFFCLDKDEEGLRATSAIVPRVGREKARMVVWPGDTKDANAALLSGLSEAAIWKLIERAQHLDPRELKKPWDYRQEVWDAFLALDNDNEPGEDPPWAMPFKFRPGEVTTWQGYTKHGKTVGLQFCLAWFAWDKQARSCIASMEIWAKRTIQNLVRQVVNQPKPEDEEHFKEALAWVDNYFWIYDCMGTVDTKAMWEVFRYAARKYGIRHFVVDSLMKTNIDEEDNNAQKQFLNDANQFAQEYNTHVHLVCHSRKPDSKHPEVRCPPHKYQVRGTAHIVDLSSNVIAFWRRKEKQIAIDALLVEIAELEKMKGSNEKADEKLLEAQAELSGRRTEHDAEIHVQGQRSGDGDEPLKNLWFDAHGGWQFRDKLHGEPVDFLTPKEEAK